MALTSGNFLTNSGTPLVGNGSNGDHYRNTINQDLWFKTLGAWTLIGNLNDDAAEGIGTIWLSGSGAPLTGNGDNGNYYRNSDNQDLWYKVVGFWTLIGTLLPVAAEGTTILSGSGVPSNGTGVDDDYYRDTVTQNIYLKTAGVWNLIGSWAAVTAGTTILSGSGVPSNGSGSDGNYYFNSVNQDIYFKSGGIWTLIGSWAAGGATAFVVGTWNMTGAATTAEPVSTLAATVGGTAPNFELTPTAPLAGSVPGSYMAIAASSAGVPKTGTGQAFAKLTLPIFDVGDNIVALSLFLVNSSATELDIVSLLNGGSPVNPVWGINTFILAPAYGGTSSSQTYANSIAGASAAGPSGWVSSDIAYFGFDYDTGNAVIQKNAGSVTQLSALDLTGFPVGDTMKVFVMLGFLSATPTLLDAPVVFSLGTTDGGKTAFTALGDATLPVGAADGLVYEVTVAGQFGGKQAIVGDYVQLYDTMTKIIVTANPDTVATAVADLSLLDGRVTTLETTVSQQPVNDTLSVRTVSAPGTTTLGVTPNAGFIRVSVGAASESFNIVAATGKVVRVLVAPEIDYGATSGDVFTLNGANFAATNALGWIFEVFDDEASGVSYQKIVQYPTSATSMAIALADGVFTNDVPDCSNPVVQLDNTALTVGLAAWNLSGTQVSHYFELHDQIRVVVLTGSAYGITHLHGQGWGLAPGESAIRYRNGVWIKL